MQKEEDIIAALRIIRCHSLSSLQRNNLLDFFKPLSALLDADLKMLQSLGITKKQHKDLHNVPEKLIENDIIWLGSENHHLLSAKDEDFPALLGEISDPPAFLFVDGYVETLKQIQIAIVGSRRPSTYGRRLAQELASGLSQIGIVVTSGLALGIDGHVHTSVLQTEGNTVAVLGNGIDNIYPVSHHALANEIARTGAIVSEFATGTPPLPHHFPRRNRIISGLTVGTVVIEAAERSGSLITARLAMEQGRNVFAVPGSVKNPLAKGCHQLIKAGAGLVETVEDILLEISALATYVVDKQQAIIKKKNSPRRPKEHQKILDLMGFESCHPNDLVERTHLTAEQVSSILLDLEVDGVVEADLCGNFVRVDN